MMASSDQEGIELGEDHIEMYEECDAVNGDQTDQLEHLDLEDDGNRNDETERVITIDVAPETTESEEPVEESEPSRKRSRSPEPEPEKEDFEDNELDSDVDESEEKDESIEDPESEEKILLSMPLLRQVMNDVGHLKQERRVMVHPLAMEEFTHPAMLSTVSKDTCEEVKIHFVRPKNNPMDWTGIVTMHFMSSRAAKESVEELQTIREDLIIESEDGTANPRVTIENWAREQKGQKRWTDTLLYITNVGENVTEDHLKEVFADAEDVVIPKNYKSKDDKKTKIAYVVYRTSELARNAASVYTTQSIELEGLMLKIYKYHMPVEGMPRGMLKLHERRVVLKYLEKLTEKLESATDEQKAPDWCTKRHKLCTEITERDNESRQAHGLSTPNLQELRAMRAVRILRGQDRRDLLIRYGVLDRPRRPYRRDSRTDRKDRSPDRRRSGGYKPSTKPKSLLGLPPPSLLSLPQVSVIPISMLMQQQQNLSFMSGMMGQRNTGVMMGSGDAGRSGGSNRSEPPGKLLRLDASGNFHVDYKDRKHSSSGRSDDRSSGRDGRSGRDDRSSGRDDRYKSEKSRSGGYSGRDRR